MVKILAVIPARGGSKGIPQKNIKLLGGKPLIQYTAESAMKCNAIAKTILSTDSEEIAAIGKILGLSVPFLRPVELAQDATPTLPVIQHAIRFLSGLGEVYDAICILQPTIPFRSKGIITKAIEKFITTGADSLISVQAVPYRYNPHWQFEVATTDFLKIATGEKKIVTRRQELPLSYHRDGSIYITKTDIIMNSNSLYGEKISFIENDDNWDVDIDTEADWEKAMAKVDYYNNITSNQIVNNGTAQY